MRHLGIYLSNESDKKKIIDKIKNYELELDFIDLRGLYGELYSAITIEKLIDDEFKHDRFFIQTAENSSLESMSSGQQSKALLNYLIGLNPQYLIVDDILNTLDFKAKEEVKERIEFVANNVSIIQIFYRKSQLFQFISNVVTVDYKNDIVSIQDRTKFLMEKQNSLSIDEKFSIPLQANESASISDPIIQLNQVSVSYLEHQVLCNVNWKINKGEFWQLKGPNGSGKSTLLSMIVGDNPKAFGQNMTLFGMQKGTGETVWDIKKHVGYFCPKMILRFTHNDSVENMIVSGFNDTIGLYQQATDIQMHVAKEWLKVLGPIFGSKYFNDLSAGQQRMVLVVRAIVKTPLLLILDEPTAGLDDHNTSLFISLINRIAKEKKIAIIYVSHQEEPNLNPDKVLHLIPSSSGSTAKMEIMEK
jgi:molybdate transport system ATP-binding protein